MEFIKGLELCETFFHEHGLPIIRQYNPNLRFTAGLIGYGSDVLGYDDHVSTDHMWGPRFYLFLQENDIKNKNDLMDLFETNLPYVYKGYSVNFSEPDPNDNGVRHSEFIDSGKVSPLIWIYTVNDFIKEYLGMMPSSNVDWLALSEHRLLGFSSGKLFIDMLDVSEIREKLSFYPHDVKMYLITSQWALIAEEQAFVKRCSDCNDEIGSMIICSRIVERLMKLCFLYKDKYAPYSKWFGTGFNHLEINSDIKEEITAALSANSIIDREKHLVKAQMLVAQVHNESSVTESINIQVEKYYDRDIDVIYADKIADKARDSIKDIRMRQYPLIGSLSQVGNFVELSDDPKYSDRIKQLYC